MRTGIFVAVLDQLLHLLLIHFNTSQSVCFKRSDTKIHNVTDICNHQFNQFNYTGPLL